MQAAVDTAAQYYALRTGAVLHRSQGKLWATDLSTLAGGFEQVSDGAHGSCGAEGAQIAAAESLCAIRQMLQGDIVCKLFAGQYDL